MKKNTLPKEFQGMLKELERLDDELGITIKPYYGEDEKELWERKKREERKALLNQIWENWPRKLILNKDVLQMRNNALKHPEVKTLLKKTNSRIEDWAFVHHCGERHLGNQRDCPAFCSPEHLEKHLIEWEFGNQWETSHDYYWGGPKDPVKILFQHSKNNRFKVIGVIEMFSEKKAA